jgi:uncharacterized protein YjbI with pentapeptide repeats
MSNNANNYVEDDEEQSDQDDDEDYTNKVFTQNDIDTIKDFSGKNLTGAKLIALDLSKAIFVKTNLHKANLTGAYLSGANFKTAILTDAILTGSKLNGTNMRGASLDSAKLIGAELNSVNLKYAGLYGVNLTGAIMTNAKLNGADVASATLIAADLRNANLTDADLFSTNLNCANLAGAVLTNAIISTTEIDFSDKTQLPANYTVTDTVRYVTTSDEYETEQDVNVNAIGEHADEDEQAEQDDEEDEEDEEDEDDDEQAEQDDEQAEQDDEQAEQDEDEQAEQDDDEEEKKVDEIIQKNITEYEKYKETDNYKKMFDNNKQIVDEYNANTENISKKNNEEQKQIQIDTSKDGYDMIMAGDSEIRRFLDENKETGGSVVLNIIDENKKSDGSIDIKNTVYLHSKEDFINQFLNQLESIVYPCIISGSESRFSLRADNPLYNLTRVTSRQIYVPYSILRPLITEDNTDNFINLYSSSVSYPLSCDLKVYMDKINTGQADVLGMSHCQDRSNVDVWIAKPTIVAKTGGKRKRTRKISQKQKRSMEKQKQKQKRTIKKRSIKNRK